MPITPEQARKARDGDLAPAIATLVERIDRYLSTTPSNFGLWYFSTEGVPSAVVKAVMEAYQAAGWKVRDASDRDGSVIAFSEPVITERGCS